MTPEPGLTFGLGVFLVVACLTGYGIYTGFGPPSKELDDPFDDHDD